MSEEIQDASVVVPRAIMFTIVINGSLAFGMLIATLFSLNDVQGALNTPTGYPYMEILLRSTHSVAGATILASILVVMQYFANVGLLASASRMCWSFARDRGLPGWNWLQHVSVSTDPTQLVVNDADMRILDLGRWTHFPSHPLHPHHHVCFASPLTHHPRIINRLQRSRLPFSLRSAILLPRRDQPSTISTLHRRDPPLQLLVHGILPGDRHQGQMGSVAHTGILGHREQHVRVRLFDNGGLLQLLADGKASHGGEYELRRLGDGGNCHLQPILLPRVGEESVYGTGDRGGLNDLGSNWSTWC